MRIAVVLDATATLAYAHGSTAVGEILAEILDARDEQPEQVCAALPAMSFLTAMSPEVTTDLYRLAHHAAVHLVSTRPDHALAAGRIAAELHVPGDTAAAAYLALQNGTTLLTRHGPALRKSRNAFLSELAVDITDGF